MFHSMRRRQLKHNFKPGDRVRTKDKLYAAEGIVLQVFDDVLKIRFETGGRVGMLPLVDHCSNYEPA